MRMANKIVKVAVAVGTLLIAAGAVAAQEKEWDFEVMPYFWAAGVEGDLEIQGNDVEVDAGFDDIFDSIDAAGGLMVEAQQGRCVIFGQFDYLGLDTDEMDSDDAPAGGSVQTDAFLGALAIGLQFDGPFNGSTIGVLAGVRYASIQTDVEITGVGSGEESQDIVDGILVVRPSFRLSERWRLNSHFAIGAGDSDLTWEVQPSVQYQVSDNLNLNLGYRRLAYDYEGDRGNTFDASFQGIIFGLGLTF